MPRRSCDGTGYLAAFRSAVASLEANVEEINALNVFPVPDGDTGSNMLATVRAALDEADKVEPGADAERVAGAISFGALMGARGNSGVIASQILAGMAHGLAGKRHFNGLDLAHALDAGTRMAYKAVAKPVEGTILTVIREASAAAVTAAERDNNVETVLAATVEAARRSVARTPSLLPILREAHVVDSGGQGLLRLFEGALAAARGEPVAGRQPLAIPVGEHDHVHPSAPGTDEGAFGYETVYLVRARDGVPLDVAAIQSHLETVGNSVLVAGDERLAKVHVHNDRPDMVIAFGLSVGTLSRITIENLDNQAHDVREARAVAFVGGVVGEAGHHAAGHADPDATTGPGPVERGADRSVVTTTERGGSDGIPAAEPAGADPEAAPTTRLPIGIVAVAPSDGLAEVLIDTATEFREHGVFHVVRGGQSANPSTGELYEAVRAMQADELFILPNNPNVILAARQVASMTDRPVHVIPTRNVAEGVAALIELDPTTDGETNAAAMTRASRGVQSMQVTEAVRDATVSGHKVKRGQSIVLDPDDGLLAADADPQRAVLAGIKHLDRGYCLMTIYYGAGASLDEAETLALRVRETTPGVDVEVVHGGQPHYRYLVSAE